MPAFLRDLRFGFRLMLRAPGITAIALVAIAPGIGSSTAIFSVVSYAVSRRIHEIGVRMIVRQAMIVVLIGTAVGLATAAAFSRIMASLLFGVSAVDPLVISIVAALLVGVALLASLIPARRAAWVDPIIALRCE